MKNIFAILLVFLGTAGCPRITELGDTTTYQNPPGVAGFAVNVDTCDEKGCSGSVDFRGLPAKGGEALAWSESFRFHPEFVRQFLVAGCVKDDSERRRAFPQVLESCEKQDQRVVEAKVKADAEKAAKSDAGPGDPDAGPQAGSSAEAP